MDALTLAYVAGLLDGEGYIGLAPAHNSPDYCSPMVQVGMTNEDLIKWLGEQFAVTYKKRLMRFNEKHKDCFVVQWRSKQALSLLARVVPYLRLKKRQAELVLEMGSLPVGNEKGLFRFQNPLPDSIRQERRRLYGLVKNLNQKGRR